MKSRSSKLEILDRPDVSQAHIKASLDMMVMINRYFGGSRVVLEYFDQHPVPDEFTVADLGTGAGDIPHALVQWALRKGKKVSITAFDTNAYCVEYAQARFASPHIRYVQHSAFDFASLGPFDYVTSSMFFHHLSDEKIVILLKAMKDNCRRGFIVNDLFRGYGGLVGITLLGLLALNYPTLHDGTISVTRGFKEADGLKYKELSGIRDLQVERRPVCRMVMNYHV